jgi:nucleotide-binding universal stress UspA family protein
MGAGASIANVDGVSPHDELLLRSSVAKEMSAEFHRAVQVDHLDGDALKAHMSTWLEENREPVQARVLKCLDVQRRGSVNQINESMQRHMSSVCLRHNDSLRQRNAISYLSAVDGSPQADMAMSVILKLRKKNDHVRVFHSFIQSAQQDLPSNRKASDIEAKYSAMLVGNLPQEKYTLDVRAREGDTTAKDTLMQLLHEFQFAAEHVPVGKSSHSAAATSIPDFVVMGHVGNKRGAAALDGNTPVLGSVTTQTLKAVHLPMIIVKQDIPVAKLSRTFMVVVGNTEHSFSCLEIVLKLTRPIDKVVCLHVATDADTDDSLTIIRTKYEDELSETGPFDSKYIVVTKTGEQNAADAIIDYVNSETDGVKVDFLAIAPRIHQETSGFSSLTTQMILHAKTNIIVCKH